MLYLVIGPSGVGKSTICSNIATKHENVIHIELDELTQIRTIPNAKVEGRTFIDSLKSTDGPLYLIDLGAGFQHDPDFHKFILQKISQCICVYADPEIAYKRKTARDNEEWRDKEEYTNDEYAEFRKQAYTKAAIRIEADQQMSNIIDELVKKLGLNE